MGGEHYTHTGGGGNYLCLPKTPKYDRYKDGHQGGGYVYGARLTHSRKVLTNTIHLALSALSSHVVRCWWCLQGTIAPLDGPRNIMGTWWVHIIPTRSKVISSALTKSLSLAPRRTRMAHYSTLWKDSVAAYRVVHMSMVESWLVLCAPSERKNVFSTVGFKGQNVIFKMNCIDLKT